MESIEEFYAGRSVFITGGTGFMGKVLIEKLLRSCPDIKAIYILVRDKYGLSAQERWDNCTKFELFDRLKKEVPGNLEKVIVLNGALSLDKFGITDEQYQNLIKNVSVIVHSAASIRFVEPISSAFRINVLGTKSVLDFALLVQNLKVFVHVSTAYSNTQFTETYEKFYEPIADYKSFIKIVEKHDPVELDILTKKITHPMVNTYVFTKHLSEQLLQDYKEKLPIVLYRPSIVVSSTLEPFPGWIDNQNGPIGVSLGTGKGILRCNFGNPDIKADWVPVDIVIKALIVASWRKGISIENKHDIHIYNASTTYKSITNSDMLTIGLDITKEIQVPGCIWQPNSSFVSNTTIYRIQAFFLHFLPALFIDLCLRLTNKKPMLLKIQVQLMSLTLVLSYFLLNEMKFNNKNFLSLIDEIPEKSKKQFDFGFHDIDASEFMKNTLIYAIKFFFNEDTRNSKTAKNRIQSATCFGPYKIKEENNIEVIYGPIKPNHNNYSHGL